MIVGAVWCGGNNGGGGRFLRVPFGPADGGAAEGDRLRVRSAGRRRLHGHPAGRRVLQPKHRRGALLLGRQQLLPEQQGQGRHLRLRRRSHRLHHRPQYKPPLLLRLSVLLCCVVFNNNYTSSLILNGSEPVTAAHLILKHIALPMLAAGFSGCTFASSATR